MVELQVVYKARKTKTFFDRLLRRLEDLSPVFNEFLEYYKQEVIPKSFGTKGALMGKKWQGLTPAYRAWKRKTSLNKSGTSGVSLRLTDKLYKAAQGGDGWFQRVTKSSMTFGIKDNIVPYANRHQFGTAGMPQRPYMFKEDGTMPEGATSVLQRRVREYLGVK